MDLVDEEDVARLEVGEQAGEVALPLERGAAGDVQADAELGGDDVRERRLAEARRAGEQAVVERVAARLGRGDVDLQLLDHGRLAHVLAKVRGRSETSRRSSSEAAAPGGTRDMAERRGGQGTTGYGVVRRARSASNSASSSAPGSFSSAASAAASACVGR